MPFRLSAWLTNNARLVMHLNSVSAGSILVVRVDGAELFRTNLPNLDGAYNVNNEYNLDIPVNLPAGKRLHRNHQRRRRLVLSRLGAARTGSAGDLRRQLAAVARCHRPARPARIAALRGRARCFVSRRRDQCRCHLQHGQTVTLTNWPAGRSSPNGTTRPPPRPSGYSQATTTNGRLTLPLPGFREDLAGLVYPPPTLSAVGLVNGHTFGFRLDSETGGRYMLEKSFDLSTWTPFLTVTNAQGTALLSNPVGPGRSAHVLPGTSGTPGRGSRPDPCPCS